MQVTEEEFKAKVADTLGWMLHLEGGVWRPRFVTGPGRSGAIASVYVSHFLKVPFVPFGVRLPKGLGGVMIVDTALKTGRTMRKAVRQYNDHWPTMQWFYDEPPRVRFWYEDWEELK